MAAKFNNSKLTRIAHRKPPPKGAAGVMQADCQLIGGGGGGGGGVGMKGMMTPGGSMMQQSTATDQKYALLFHITPFQLGNLGKFDDCDAQGVILWQRAFNSVNRSQAMEEVGVASWQDLSQVLRHKFSLFTGAHRPLSDSDLLYLAEKLIIPANVDNKPITFQRFAKINLREDVSFSFWEWFFLIMQLIKQKLLKFWDEGWLVGFISKQDASQRMLMAPTPTFLLRFSDTQTGAVSIGFVCEEEGGVKVPFHLSPFTIKDLDQLSLAQRIASCPQLKEIRYLYPDIDKEEMVKCFEGEERHKSESPTGYIQAEVVMLAKMGARVGASSLVGSDSPSPMSNNSRPDWSPGDFQHTNSMDISDEIATMLSQSQFESAGCVECLLGSGFRPQQPMVEQPLHQVDLSSFIDANFGVGGQPYGGLGGSQHHQPPPPHNQQQHQ